MFRVTLWPQLLLLVLILKQTDAAAYRSGEMQEKIEGSEESMTKTTELKHNNGEQADNCCACQSLLEAARSGEVNTVKNLLKCCKDTCSERDKFCNTPLIYAAEFGNVEVVRVLLEGGANAETANAHRWTALHAAARKGHVDVCRLLLDWGAKVDPLNEWKDTPLHWAAREGHLSVVKLLVERGADVRVKDIFGSNPLDLASFNGYVSLLKLLVPGGADVRMKDALVPSEVYLGQFNEYLSMVKLLGESGGEVTLNEILRFFPPYDAIMTDYVVVVKLLWGKGADVTLKDKDGPTVSDLARSAGKVDEIEWLTSVIESLSYDVDTDASNRTATDCLTTSVRSQNQTAILESGQQQGVQTAAGEPAEKLGLVSREEDKDCGPEEDACRSLLEAARSGDVDRAKSLAKCESSDNCTDGSFFPVTPQTDGLRQVHEDIASNNSQVRDRIAVVKARDIRSVRGGLWLCPGRKKWDRSPGVAPCRLRDWGIWKS